VSSAKKRYYCRKVIRVSFRLNIKYFLVHRLGFTNKEAIRAIEHRRLKVNGSVITENIEFNETWDIYLDDNLLKPNTPFTYIACYKPRGIETTNNQLIKDNLTTVFKFDKHLGYAGRLDKESEGLLLLSNDGKYIQSLSSPIKEKEKEYLVTVNKPISDEFIIKMGNGVDIMICKTQACKVEKLSEFEFRIILKEGKNRQIRRMCKALGYQVARLIRVRIDSIRLDGLKPGEYREYQL
jgi:23S rRNA pseudouridine2604 synthase